MLRQREAVRDGGMSIARFRHAHQALVHFIKVYTNETNRLDPILKQFSHKFYGPITSCDNLCPVNNLASLLFQFSTVYKCSNRKLVHKCLLQGFGFTNRCFLCLFSEVKLN